MRNQGGGWESVTYADEVFEYHKKGSEEKNYVQLGGGIEIRVGGYSDDSSDKAVYQLKDHLGSVGIRINQSGGTIDREEYYPFGDSSLRTFDKKRYRYCGKEKDEESGLYYYGARYYMAWVGRFISIDPLADRYAHLTPYNYGDNSPITHYDVDGMQTPVSAMTPNAQLAKGGIGAGIGTALPTSTGTSGFRDFLDGLGNGFTAKVTGTWQMAKHAVGNYGWVGAAKSWQKGNYLDMALNISGYKFVIDNWKPLLMTPITPTLEGWSTLSSAYQGNWGQVGQDTGGKLFDASLALAGAKLPTLKLPANFNLNFKFRISLPKFASSGGIQSESTAAKGEVTVYRVFGGDARAQGFSWTTKNPTSIKDFRNAAGLPSGGASGATNTADFMIKGRVNINNIKRCPKIMCD